MAISDRDSEVPRVALAAGVAVAVVVAGTPVVVVVVPLVGFDDVVTGLGVTAVGVLATVEALAVGADLVTGFAAASFLAFVTDLAADEVVTVRVAVPWSQVGTPLTDPPPPAPPADVPPPYAEPAPTVP
jgi:hypothetical protein